MQRYYVYIWFLADSGEVFYVGKGSGNRVTSLKDRNRHFLNIRRKCKCDYRIVRYFDTEEEAYRYELELGKEYKAKGQAWCCYVLGKTDKYLSGEVKKKISASLKGSTPWNKGKKMPESYKQKLSEAKKGKKQSAETKRRRSMSLLGHEVTEQTKRKISDAMQGEKNHMYGKKQSQETIMKRAAKLKGRKVSEVTRQKIGLANGRQVDMLDPVTGEILRTYNSASEAARANGLNNSKISAVCNGVRKTTGGFGWRYSDMATPS